jgi:dTDP-4-dehydrorhamnose 3,5-epimerase
MLFTKTKLDGVFVIEPEKQMDERGFFARTWCQQEFASQKINSRLAQCSISFNAKKGTLRGMHYQAAPYPEAKLVRCTMGAIYDVVVDLRTDSPTYKQWLAMELTAENRCAIYIPEDCAHGFQTLTDNSEVFYQISEFFYPECSRGIRWNDPAFAITWPIYNPTLSKRDFTYPDYSPDTHSRN